ncbi:MAG: hypothetical protein WC144_06005 [Sulfurimonas sp.]|jgi:hypothetical protein
MIKISEYTFNLYISNNIRTYTFEGVYLNSHINFITGDFCEEYVKFLNISKNNDSFDCSFRLADLNIYKNTFIYNFGDHMDKKEAIESTKAIIKIYKDRDKILCFTSHNRYVQNNIPLKYWNVLFDNNIKIYNKHNSKKIWDEWNYTGLCNADLIDTKFILYNNKKKKE